MSLPVPDMIDLCSDDECGESDVIKGSSKKPKNQGGSLDDSSHRFGTSLPPPPISRQFWKAGDYEGGQGQVHGAANQRKYEKNHLHVHPMFLHSNATSHKWVFGAIAELVDNAIDEIKNGATFVDINKIANPRGGGPALQIQDNGGGMDPEEMRRCLSFGFSKKMKCAIGRYGNGFKASTMRLGADVVVFSRHRNMRSSTQSVGLLSYTFLRSMGHEKIIIPMVDYEFNSSTESFGPIFHHGMEHFSSNLTMLLQWSPYSTEDEFLKQFDDIGDQGTKIVMYNLWFNDDGDMELDFDSDIEDIRISGDVKLFGEHSKPIFQQHIANVYNYSLRVYLSILYLRLPQFFNIKLRGRVVEQHNIADDLKFAEFILYRPQTGVKDQTAVITTIGFLKEAPDVNVHGFNIYYRNRLILPFWRVLRNTTNSSGRGIVGVLEANYIEPTHNKQDFERSSLFQKLEDRLKQMTIEYWHLHCELIGYQGKKSSALPSQEMHYSETGTKEELNTKRRGPVPLAGQEFARAYAADTWHIMEDQSYIRSKQQVQREKASLVMQQNKKLRLQISELEKNVEGFYLKVEQLQSELIEVQHECTRLLAESKAMDIID
ncbi:protein MICRORCHIDIA 6 isoform X2 [Manihot esculenta]|uniref:Uncharacterized protein n=1 Tax=Manihot esculenta TaxID=3983 RepID=A0ACB7G4R0_MANES|nr:protein MICRORCHIDIA 6 isoform X2 [Manihot esculenta]KAG8635011.1 hypothetical protein MANES_17G114700v8 [Manihot esculenta]